MSSVNGGNNLESFSSVPREWNDFCRFIEANYRVIYTVALAQVRDADVAQEITQDVCVRLLLEREKLFHITNPSGWLARVARNTAIDWVRRRQTHSRALTMMESWNHAPAASAVTPKDARHAATIGEENQRLYAALDLLPADDREILLMHFMDGMDKQQIARLLETHPSTVGRRIDKSLRFMKKSLKDFQPEGLATQLTRLRPTEHTSRSVLATLTAVAALGAAEKTALAAALAPLPILSAGAGASAVSAATLKGGIWANALHSMTGWGVPVLTGVGLVIGVLIFTGYSAIFKTDTSTAGSAKITAMHTAASNSSDMPALRKISASKVRRKSEASPMMKGLTSVGAYSAGYLQTGITDGKTLQGTVTDEIRKPVPGAAVTLRMGSGNKETSRTVASDAEGKFEFKDLPGATHGKSLWSCVTATADGYAHATVGEYEVVLPLPTISVSMQVVLAKPVSMHGFIINDNGEPVPDAKVIVLSEFDAHKQQYQEDGYNDAIFITHSDSAGTFTFDALKPGYVALAVEHPEYAPQLSEAIPSNSKSARIGVNKGVSVVGTVHDGVTTMPGVTVKFSGTFKGTGSGPNQTVVTDKHGRFEATRLPVYGIDYDNARLPVRRKDQDTWDYNVSVGKYEETTVPLYGMTIYRAETTRTLEINAKDPRATKEGGRRYVQLKGQPPLGQPVDRAAGAVLHGTVVIPEGLSSCTQVNVLVRQGVDFWQSISVHNGVFELHEIPPGTYKVSGKTLEPGFDNSHTFFGPQNVTVREGELHTIELHPGDSGVRGRVTGNHTGTTATVQIVTADPLSPWYEGAGEDIGEQTVGVDGSFEFRGLVPGDYYLVVIAGTQIYNEPFKCRAGEIANFNVALPPLLTVTGSVIDSATSTPVQGARISFSRAAKAIGDLRNRKLTSATTDKDGKYATNLTTGSYILFVYPLGGSKQQNLQVEIRNDQTEIPEIDISTLVGGIRISRLGFPADGIMWRQAEFDLVDLDSGNFSNFPKTKFFLDDDTAIIPSVPIGKYGLVVRCTPFGGDNSQLFATAYYPNLEVKPDLFEMVMVPLQNGVPVKLYCEPGGHITSWERPHFWLKDPSGVTIPVRLSNGHGQELLMGLAPGSYELGVTLDSGEQQSVTFDVGPGEKEKEVVLRLQ